MLGFERRFERVCIHIIAAPPARAQGGVDLELFYSPLDCWRAASSFINSTLLLRPRLLLISRAGFGAGFGSGSGSGAGFGSGFGDSLIFAATLRAC